MRLVVRSLLVSATLAVSVAACTQTTPPVPMASASGTARMADNTGCKGEVESYRAIMTNDLSMGHVNQSVYARIEKEIDRAEATCVAGHDAEAVRMVNATKSRYGYR